MPEQLAFFFDDDSDWAKADGWHSAQLHACAMNHATTDPRWYLGDGPKPGVIGIHLSGCSYRREETMNP
ncbi:hypothetical protein [Thiocystis violacea]|uniref:hypothetical protein n=1 Tax=Thiocystis violacea TaxID=13725 RepID=UPI0019031BCA|nr:hypothetical protein [Thiocystis violacea]MBK1719185.1 hypothetical protein [Thiocystis violacea]